MTFYPGTDLRVRLTPSGSRDPLDLRNEQPDDPRPHDGGSQGLTVSGVGVPKGLTRGVDVLEGTLFSRSRVSVSVCVGN